VRVKEALLVSTRNRFCLAWFFMFAAPACAGRPLDVTARPVAAPPAPSPALASPSSSAPAASVGSAPPEAAPPAEPSAPQACPSGMVHVQFNHCPKLERRCLDKEYDKPNHISICNRFATDKPKCREPRVPLDFCIDEYEYPNQAGKKPPVMLNFFEAGALCAAQQKRLCYEREWVTACEGPEEKPFPYGYVRSSKQCNFDNRWIDPHLSRVYSTDPDVQRAELERLDRSVPSGQMASCVSDYGVHDLTGNVDEWTLADHDRPREHAKFSALKGGAWGHVRNACRPVTTSHSPEFRYYFIGLRCCSDAKASTAGERQHDDAAKPNEQSKSKGNATE
jgi:sulfatase modifying factor 1